MPAIFRTLRFDLSEGEFTRAHRVHLKRSLLTVKNLIFVSFALAIAASQAQVFGTGGMAGKIFALIWAGIISLAVYAYVALPGRLYRRWHATSTAHEITFGNTALDVRAGDFAHSYPWDTLSRVLFSQEDAFIYPKQGVPVIVPTRVFESADELAVFKSAVEAKISAP